MSLRPVSPLRAPDIMPAELNTPEPTFEWVAPETLLIDDAYQRTLGEKGVSLIRKIIANWDWARFKPPIVAATAGGLEVIDGQHTAIAAASHPGIEKIPVMMVFAPMQSLRAGAFVGHNRDRIAITPTQLHISSVAAGDEDALTVQGACERAGATILRYPPSAGRYKPGETMAVGTLRSLVNRRGAMAGRVIIQCCAEAHCAPITSLQLRAVEMLLHDREYRGQVTPADITSAMLRLGPQANREAFLFANAHNIRQWRALGIILFKEARRGRRGASRGAGSGE